MEIPFRVIIDKSFSLLSPKGRTITLRASQQSYDVSGGKILNRGLKITIRTIPKGLDLGTLGVGKMTETKNTLEIVYMKIEESGSTLLELDKLNFIFALNGEDILKEVRNQI
jgi:P2 family phage contractile tail tube protein